ncbi:MAG: methyltransferase [Clostridia bacterium]|nr:methyltransferase [Clostridia bacterium]
MRREPLGNGFFVEVSENHTFGTDAVLLANFAAPRKKDTLVDLGTGCGIIPLLMLRDGAPKSAVGVEISDEAVELAQRTVAELGIENFSVLHADLCDLSGKLPFGCHTLVTCNPPYKANGAGLQNPVARQAVARHEISCTLRDVVFTAARLLQTAGRFCVCHRPERLGELMTLMHEAKLEPKRLRLVCQRKGEEPWLVLVEGKKGAHTGLRITPTLYVEENGKLSPEMVDIYGIYKEGHL